jgi:hypothetical protein
MGQSRIVAKYAPSLVLAAILGYQLFVWPPIGLANNGDFGKIISLFSLGTPRGDEYIYVKLTYQFGPAYHWKSGYYSSEMLLVGAAVGLNHLLSKDGSFDLRLMGLIHSLLLILAANLLVGVLAGIPGWRRWLLWTMAIFCFSDVMYVSYFNSFYMDAGALIFLTLAVVFFLRAAAWRNKVDTIWLIICVVLLLLSKSQHAILGLWLAPLFALFGSSLWPHNGRVFSVVSAAVVVCVTILSVKLSPFDYAARGYYTVIFTQILPHSKNVTADLQALGLDDSYLNRIGTHAYSDNAGMDDPEFARVFMQRTSYARLGWFFLTHPRDAPLALEVSLGEAGRQRPPMGNFDRSAGLPALSESQAFAVWSNAKRRIFHEHGIRYLNYCVFTTVLICAITSARRRTLPNVLLAGIFALAGMGISETLVASLADAVDVTRHYFISAAILDLEFLVFLAVITFKVHTRYREPSSGEIPGLKDAVLPLEASL